MTDQLVFSDGYVNNIKMLEERIKNLEAMLNQTTNFLDEIVSRGNLYNISNYMHDAEELIGEARSFLEGEFEE
jgi:hypothetical protein